MLEMLEEIRYALYSYIVETVVITVGGMLAFIAFGLLCSTWSSVKERSYLISIRKRYYDDPVTHVVKKAHVITQRSRYTRIAIAFTMCGPWLVWLFVNSLDAYIITERATDAVPALGWFLVLSQFMITLTTGACLLLIVRVYSAPSVFRKRIMFGEGRGNYVLTGLHRFSSTAIRLEAKMRDRNNP